MSLPPKLIATIRASQTRIAVTGARGWFGRVSLSLLEEALGHEDFIERVSVFTSDGNQALLSDDLIEASPFSCLAAQLDEPTLLLHYAFRTKEQENEPEFVSDNLNIITTVLGAIETGNISGLFMVSSGASRTKDGKSTTDLSSHPYGTLKNLEELAYQAACSQHNIPLVIARTYSVAGPYMTKPHLYALGNLIHQARHNEIISIHACGLVTRSYAGVKDVVSLALAVLHDKSATSPLVFETGGEVVEVEDLAKRVCQVLGRDSYTISREIDPSAPADEYLANDLRYKELLGQYSIPTTTLDDLIQEVAEFPSGS